MASTAKQLKAAILQRAIEGKLVKQDSNDEPAIELLKRIKAAKNVKDAKKSKPLPPITDDEKPFSIPDSWEWVRLGEICEIRGGKRIPAGRKLTNVDTGHKYIRVADMKNGSVCLDHLMFVPQDIYPSISRYIIKKEDVFITVAGTLGRVGKIPSEIDGANLTENADRLILSSVICQDWLIYVLNSWHIKKEVASAYTQVGQPKLAILRLALFTIPLPPLAEQKRIVEKIESILPLVDKLEKLEEEKIKLDEELPKKLEKSILQMAIEGKLVKQDPNDEPASELLKRIKAAKNARKSKPLPPITDDEKPFQIPDSWQWVRLGEIIDFIVGKTPPRGDSRYWGKEKYNWLSISDMVADGVTKQSKEKISEEASCELFKGRISKAGSLIMSFKLTVGRTSILGIDSYHNEAIATIVPYYDESNRLRNYLFKMLPIVTKNGESKKAIKGETLNSKSINNLVLPLPPLAEQKRIVEKIESLQSLCRKLSKTISKEAV